MEYGMLWFDNEAGRAVEEKVRQAAAHYERKYGDKPNVCFVHPSMLKGDGVQDGLLADGVQVRPGRAILPDHFWVGVEEN